MATVQSPPAEQRMVLHGISWETYERLLADHENSSAPRFTYDRGDLEIMSPLPDHERYNRLVQILVPLAAREMGIRVYSLGSTTFRREVFERGIEADSCFYVRNVGAVRGKDRIDLRVDPPPDLVVEIEITNPLLSKLPIYAQFRVPEVWRYDGQRMEILVLADRIYSASSASRALPAISAAALSKILAESHGLDDFDWLDHVRDWARTLL